MHSDRKVDVMYSEPISDDPLTARNKNGEIVLLKNVLYVPTVGHGRSVIRGFGFTVRFAEAHDVKHPIEETPLQARCHILSFNLSRSAAFEGPYTDSRAAFQRLQA